MNNIHNYLLFVVTLHGNDAFTDTVQCSNNIILFNYVCSTLTALQQYLIIVLFSDD